MVPPTPKRLLVFVLFLCRVQLVLRSGVLTVLDLDKVNVTLRFAEVFRSLLSGICGSTGGWWCCWGAPISLNCPLPLWRTHPPTPVFCFFVFAAMGVTSTNSGRLEVNLPLSGSGVGRAIWEQFYFQLFQESGDFAWSSVREMCA